MPARKAPAKTPSKPPAKPKAAKTSVRIGGKAGPNEDAVRRRAYEIFLERGGAPGDPQQDWERAVKELSAPRRKVAAK